MPDLSGAGGVELASEGRPQPKNCGSEERARRQEELASEASDMDVVFLGTASCIPSATRGVSCVALRYEGKTWIFDCGEGSQVQVQKSTQTHPGRVDAIFVTHCHGDHTFGLPGLLCIIGQNRAPDAKPIDIFGPAGLAVYLRASLQLTQSRVAAKYVVHELLDVPLMPPLSPPGGEDGHRYAPAGTPPALEAVFKAGDDADHTWSRRMPARETFGEVGRRAVPRDPDGAWTLHVPGSPVTVRAATMVHGVPCVGYCVFEPDRPGRLDVAKVEPALARNFAALKDKGVKHPKKVYQLIKDMPAGKSLTFPDGTRIKRDDVVDADKPGRVVCVCGDTADASAVLPVLKGRRPDLVIHEATNAHLSPWDDHLDPAVIRRVTAGHGHSTPDMAADFATRVRARRLVLTHFSPRYKGDDSPQALAVMAKIEAKARDNFAGSVVAAWDLLHMPIPQPPSLKASASPPRDLLTTPTPRKKKRQVASSKDDVSRPPRRRTASSSATAASLDSSEATPSS